MNIIIQEEPPRAPQRPNYINYQKLGFWATVTEVNSETNTCTVLTANKEPIRDLPIATREWVSDDSQERNLPPEGSFVFILMPDNCISNAFVLCSGYPRGETSLQGLYANGESDRARKNTERETVTPGRWNEKEDYISGTRSITSPDEKVEVKVTMEDRKSKSLEINAFGKSIEITEGGVAIKTKEGITVETQGTMKLKASKLDVNDGALEVV